MTTPRVGRRRHQNLHPNTSFQPSRSSFFGPQEGLSPPVSSVRTEGAAPRSNGPRSR
jgi:hypothetical protein